MLHLTSDKLQLVMIMFCNKFAVFVQRSSCKITEMLKIFEESEMFEANDFHVEKNCNKTENYKSIKLEFVVIEKKQL